MNIKKSSKQYKRNWFVQSVLGLYLTTGGICIAIDAALVRQASDEILYWVLYGSLALIILNSGLCFIGGAVLNRVKYEWLMQEEAKKQA